MTEPEDEPTKIVCSPADSPGLIPGGVLVPCEECAMPCSVSPSSFDVLASGAAVICYRCFEKHLREDTTGEIKIMKHPNAAGQRDEIETWRRRRER